ncbi:hypothetical protein HKD37_03G007047 [Glycine soja]|uniref:DUF3527 domain-containing protein n=2 Tax=Glycine subgen. Soja TaxID=1462606 RepID=K7KDK4_SOYBN|nr:uncharacterized protein LOC114406247 [Glycine soja]XP_028224697.1 uncharacterized protein LOC114406247 [Glycine soja]XP_028224698.1 uncharacterized protein LOC114406247 [Glycine soja]KAG5042619.1 hypothetical protein JHK87_006534 [Glycine soja]RZC19561.1 hypothetical protein D0Y65_006409 [Glycine soja]RZC19562.1 hypothetical protein D0Y65_006409 [Glycine soja]RZC19563.1 hypothetical protein D0Y65_006409 [Glycine soja]RZC19564.1 hypothetical protein D0Y65_006409 [Glycine soja]|eukprot:XP_006576586.1 uncharacterized protein LOC102665809 [Glycine max]
MPINIHPSNGFLKPAEDMGFGLEFRKSSTKQHSSSKTVKESLVLPHSKRSSKDADKLKPKSDLKQKGKMDAEGKIQNSETVRRRATERDELVKHMSNLPGYLLRTDKVENFQEKAFNVGVLDWSRLEKWKHKQKHIPVLASSFTSLNSSELLSRTATKPSTSVGGKEKLSDKKSLPSSGIIKSSYRESLPESAKLPFYDVKRFESSKSVTKSIGDEKSLTPRAFESFGNKTHLDISLEKKRRNGYSKRSSHAKNFESKAKLHGISYLPNENGRDDGAKQNMEDLQEHKHKKKERNHKSSSDMGHPSVKSKGKGASSSSKKMSSSCSETRKKVDQLQELDFDGGQKHCHSKPSNIVLLCPGEIPQSSSSEDFQLSESRTSSVENFSESTKSSLSYVSLPDEDYTADGCSEIPPSGPPCSAVEFSSSETMQHSISTDMGVDHSSVVSKTPSSIIHKMSSLQPASGCFEKDMLDSKLRDQYAFSKLKESLDQETAELTAQKEMNPSHNRRFSFSLSRIGRSFSFKEGPTLPQYSSVYVSAKSGPVTPQSSVRWDNPSKEKVNSHIRNRSSPLRRLLDPLLKHKASDKHNSAQSSQALEGGSANSSFRTIGVNESLLAEKSKGSSVQGLLQLTIKNGVPLFKFVLNNERKIFAATRNSLASLEKGDLGSCFTFYLVNEIKKKSGGWISHGNKEKSCGYAYNVIAQMKFSSSKIAEPTNQNSSRKCMVKEYVLVSVEIGQTDQGPPKFIQSVELAAVVVETSCEKTTEGLHDDNNMLKKGCSKCLTDERCLCSSGENEASDCTTVILPGGVHGSPNKGEPTPLIYRWKTGGSCDCGGWDIGCRLLVLSNQNQNSSIPKSYKPYNDRFQLFVKEGTEKDTSLFTLLPLKDGFYSVEFDSTITHLQAFFISVVALSCQKLPGSLEMGSMHEEVLNLKEPSSMNNRKLQGKAPLKYAPIPPLSPVGRV